ncbi:3-oxoacyl-of acyl-carrier-protein synthase I [Spatholobus suberectus]|nr:3-oxoacyl-of acyl-carrier-protein synthase I [Spatholobus suberectus]
MSLSLHNLFFYHSGSKTCHIVGVVSVIQEWVDEAVDVQAIGEMSRLVDLKEMKHFKDFALLRQRRVDRCYRVFLLSHARLFCLWCVAIFLMEMVVVDEKLLERGEADIIVVGGTEAAIMPTGVGGFIACRALSQRDEDPKKDFKTMGQRPWFCNG